MQTCCWIVQNFNWKNPNFRQNFLYYLLFTVYFSALVFANATRPLLKLNLLILWESSCWEFTLTVGSRLSQLIGSVTFWDTFARWSEVARDASFRLLVFNCVLEATDSKAPSFRCFPGFLGRHFDSSLTESKFSFLQYVSVILFLNINENCIKIKMITRAKGVSL